MERGNHYPFSLEDPQGLRRRWPKEKVAEGQMRGTASLASKHFQIMYPLKMFDV
jgi:hypothetical protein